MRNIFSLFLIFFFFQTTFAKHVSTYSFDVDSYSGLEFSGVGVTSSFDFSGEHNPNAGITNSSTASFNWLELFFQSLNQEVVVITTNVVQVVNTYCSYYWDCSDWTPSTCPLEGVQGRVCENLGSCVGDLFKPVEEQDCVYDESLQENISDVLSNASSVSAVFERSLKISRIVQTSDGLFVSVLLKTNDSTDLIFYTIRNEQRVIILQENQSISDLESEVFLKEFNVTLRQGNYTLTITVPDQDLSKSATFYVFGDIKDEGFVAKVLISTLSEPRTKNVIFNFLIFVLVIIFLKSYSTRVMLRISKINQTSSGIIFKVFFKSRSKEDIVFKFLIKNNLGELLHSESWQILSSVSGFNKEIFYNFNPGKYVLQVKTYVNEKARSKSKTFFIKRVVSKKGKEVNDFPVRQEDFTNKNIYSRKPSRFSVKMLKKRVGERKKKF